jgi:uncharacterized protein (TIGR02118 family)
MAKLIAMYKTPTDPAAFDRYYFATHVRIAKTLPGLLTYDVTRGPVMTPQGPSPYHLVATLSFPSRAAIEAAFASPEGQATVADVGKFATGGVEIFFADDEVV